MRMGAILIDAHLAANAIGATPTARPEDTELDPRTGDLLIAFTSAGADDGGVADPAVFQGPEGQPSWPYGWVMRLKDDAASATSPGGAIEWQMVATGGPPWEGGLGFANPDNLAIDQGGHLWMVTDRSNSDDRTDLFGNNACWILPNQAEQGQEALLFASGPMECELCGPCFDSDEKTLFLAVQHPGEQNGCHRQGAEEIQAFKLLDRRGGAFEQLRTVPLGSNWPSGVPDRAPRPSVVSIQRVGGGALLNNR
jgi:secreted PhoX family phosphatase